MSYVDVQEADCLVRYSGGAFCRPSILSPSIPTQRGHEDGAGACPVAAAPLAKGVGQAGRNPGAEAVVDPPTPAASRSNDPPSRG